MSEVISFPGLNLEFNVPKIALSIGGVTIYWYGVLIALGFLLAVFYAVVRAKKFGIDINRLTDVVLVSAIGGIVGARLYYVLFSLEDFQDNWLDIFKIWEGGIAIYGGLIAAIIVGYFMCKWRQVKFLPALDLASLGFLIGQGIGRWGNFVNNEAFGCNTNLPWGMTSQSIKAYLQSPDVTEKLASTGVTVNPDLPVHPTFLYESLWCLLGFVILHFYSKHRKFDGEVFLMYIGWYGLGRAVFEGLRTDSLYIGTIRVSQVVAILCVIAAIIIICIVRGKIKRENDPEYLKLYVLTEESKMILEKGIYPEKPKKKHKRQKESPSVTDLCSEEDGEDTDEGSLDEESDDEMPEKESVKDQDLDEPDDEESENEEGQDPEEMNEDSEETESEEEGR